MAAVPRRKRPGRRSLKEEEEGRPHSEPVGEKYAQALAQYTAEMESGMGREPLQRTERMSPSLDWTDTGAEEDSRVVPQINLIEASSSSSETFSSQDNFQSSVSGGAPVCRTGSVQQSTGPRSEQTVSLGSVDSDDEGDIACHVATPRVGDKRELKESEPRSTLEASPRKKRAKSESSVDGTPESRDQRSSEGLRGWSHSSVSGDENDDGAAHVPGRDSEGSFSADSLDEGDDTNSPAPRTPLYRDSEGIVFEEKLRTVPGLVVESGPCEEQLERGSGGFFLREDPRDSDRRVPSEYGSTEVESDNVSASGLRLSESAIPSEIQTTDSPTVTEHDRPCRDDRTAYSVAPSSAAAAESGSEGFHRSAGQSPNKGSAGGDECSAPSASAARPDYPEPSSTQDKATASSAVPDRPDSDARSTVEGRVPGAGNGGSAIGGREVPVAMEMLTLLAEEEGSQLSDEASSSHVEQQIQAWQEVLQQLSPR